MTRRDPRRRGRPPVDPTDRSVLVTVTLPGRRYDALCRRALRLQTSLPEIIRRELEPPEKTPNK
jgi:hypothetical protein